MTKPDDSKTDYSALLKEANAKLAVRVAKEAREANTPTVKPTAAKTDYAAALKKANDDLATAQARAATAKQNLAKSNAPGWGVSLVAGLIFVVGYATCSSTPKTHAFRSTDYTSAPPAISAAEVLKPYKEARCSSLGDVAAGAFIAKKGHNSLQAALNASVLPGQPKETQVAQGVVMAIYGDRNIKSESQARAAAVTACNSVG